MKQHHSIFLLPAASLACTLILMLAACTPDATDELTSAGTDPDARPLTISVSDGGMYATGQTRAQERGYRTVFTEGDRIGLYVVNGSTLEVKNRCLTLRSGEWTAPAGTPQLLYSPGRNYHAYYPYRDDGYMDGKVSPDGQDFFKPAVDAWEVKTDQSTYAQYTASDLMTARGVYSNHTLSFAMEHRMALLIFQMPVTKYNYTETIDGQEISKSYYRYTVVGTPFLHENPSEGRYLLNPDNSNPATLGIKYYSAGQPKDFSIETTDLNPQPGRYTIVPVDGGAVTEETRALQEGDFYMKDGGILPQSDVTGTMPDNDKRNCLGVVFWVGEKSSSVLRNHWTYEDKRGDRLLMHEHPECTHGLVVALKDAANGQKKSWSNSTDKIWDWLYSYTPATDEQKAEKDRIRNSSDFFGYNASRRIQWWRDYAGKTTEAYNAVEQYAKDNAIPPACSGWYFPGDNEMGYMAVGTLDYTEEDNRMSEKLNTQFEKAGGDKFKTDWYWSSTENVSGEKSYCVKFDDTQNDRYLYDKTSSCYVRAVLAF